MHKALIDEFGGARRLAWELKLPYETTRKWRQRGIPPQYWRRIARIDKRISWERLALAAASAREESAG